MFRGLVTILTFVVSTFVLGVSAIVAVGLTRRPEMVFRLGKVWSRLLLASAGIRPTYEGLEHVAGRAPRVFLANHLSTVDIWVLAAVLPDTTVFVSKRSIFWIPVLGQAMAVGGFISIDRRDRVRAIRSMDRAAATIRGGVSIILFPEGTRSRDGKLAPFKKGSFHLALAAGVPVVPVAISGTGKVAPPRSIVVHDGEVRVTFLPPVDPAPYAPDDLQGLMARVRSAIVAHLAPEELPNDEATR
jgi:1-acyl-sn-glycerol-3-phosphate acyltransferase